MRAICQESTIRLIDRRAVTLGLAAVAVAPLIPDVTVTRPQLPLPLRQATSISLSTPVVRS